MKIRYNEKRGKMETNVYYTKNDGKRASRIIRADSKQELVEAVQEFKERMNKESISSKELTLENWFKFYVENLSAKKKTSTILVQKSLFNSHVPKHLKEKSLSKITPEQLQLIYSEAKEKGYAENTIAFLHQIISTVFNSAVKYGKIATNPNKDTVVRGYRNGKKVYVDVDDFNKLLKHLENKQCYLEVLFLFTTGVRRGEMLGLKWDKIDTEKKTAYIKTQIKEQGGKIIKDAPLKTKSSERVVKIPDFVFDKIMEHKSNSTSEYVFTNKGRSWNPTHFSRLVKRAAKEVGLDDLTPKQFRNSFVKLAVINNVNLKVVQQALGHSKFSTTADIYGELTQEDAFCIADVFDNIQSQSSNIMQE